MSHKTKSQQAKIYRTRTGFILLNIFAFSVSGIYLSCREDGNLQYYNPINQPYTEIFNNMFNTSYTKATTLNNTKVLFQWKYAINFK